MRNGLRFERDWLDSVPCCLYANSGTPRQKDGGFQTLISRHGRMAAISSENEDDDSPSLQGAVREEVEELANTFPAAFDQDEVSDEDASVFASLDYFMKRRKRVLGMTLSVLAIAQNARRRKRLPPVLVTPQDWAQYRAEKIERGLVFCFADSDCL
jgi:hypothetical protein